jgi:PAS domain S-box-containing protein
MNENEMRLFDQKMQLYIQQTPLAVIEWDTNFTVIEWNPAAEKIFGYTAVEAMGQNVKFIVPDTFKESAGGAWNELLTQKISRRSMIENITKDNRTIICEWHNTPLVDESGKVIGVVSLVEDISDHRQVEALLTTERDMLRSIIDNLPDRIYVKDLQSRFLLNNRTHLTALGAKQPENVIGKTDFDFRTRERAMQYFLDDQEVIKSGQALYNREEPTTLPGGEKGWLLSSKVPLTDQQGNIIGLIGISRDITKRKEAELEKERLFNELQKALHEVKTLSGLLPICANCKKVRDDQGYWNQIEKYFTVKSDVQFTHGICPECLKILYPKYAGSLNKS